MLKLEVWADCKGWTISKREKGKNRENFNKKGAFPPQLEDVQYRVFRMSFRANSIPFTPKPSPKTTPSLNAVLATGPSTKGRAMEESEPIIYQIPSELMEKITHQTQVYDWKRPHQVQTFLCEVRPEACDEDGEPWRTLVTQLLDTPELQTDFVEAYKEFYPELKTWKDVAFKAYSCLEGRDPTVMERLVSARSLIPLFNHLKVRSLQPSAWKQESEMAKAAALILANMKPFPGPYFSVGQITPFDDLMLQTTQVGSWNMEMLTVLIQSRLAPEASTIIKVQVLEAIAHDMVQDMLELFLATYNFRDSQLRRTFWKTLQEGDTSDEQWATLDLILGKITSDTIRAKLEKERSDWFYSGSDSGSDSGSPVGARGVPG
jgi:hypothetical protein